MAVKVMWAPALRASPVERVAPAAAQDEAPPRPGASERPRRRKSSVFDAEGNEVFITLMCLKCRKMRPLAQFGLRRMPDGAIRNQPWCRPCRSDAGPKKRRGTSETAPSPASTQCRGAPQPTTTSDAGLLAAQVAAALHNGRR